MLNLKIQLFGGRGRKSGLGLGGTGLDVPTIKKNSQKKEDIESGKQDIK